MGDLDLDGLKPCPFCGRGLAVRRLPVGSWAACETPGCYGSRSTRLELDDPERVAAWNRRPVARVIDPVAWRYRRADWHPWTYCDDQRPDFEGCEVEALFSAHRHGQEKKL